MAEVEQRTRAAAEQRARKPLPLSTVGAVTGAMAGARGGEEGGGGSGGGGNGGGGGQRGRISSAVIATGYEIVVCHKSLTPPRVEPLK